MTLAVFAYDFPHRKTHDFLVEIALSGRRKVTVISAPAKPLHGIDRTQYWPKTLRPASSIDTVDLCERLGFTYVKMDHDAVDDVVDLARQNDLQLGVISGARILKRGVIEAFTQGIVNFHPGPIPETSGLDAFFYAIRKGVDTGVTTHLIDPRVDAGQFLAFDPVQLGLTDPVDVIQENSYQLQLVALRRFLSDHAAGRMNPVAIDRPASNRSMKPEEKWAELANFPAWRASRVRVQATANIHTAARNGNVISMEELLNQFPDLIEAQTPEGWTPIILAAHAGHDPLVRKLLELGANPNATGRNGTTVLMYAKTPLMAQNAPDTAILDVLIAHGADPVRHDRFGRQVLSYVQDHVALSAYFRGKGGHWV